MAVDQVGGHGGGMSHAHPLPPGDYFDLAALPRHEPVTDVVLRDLGTRPIYELRTTKGVRLVDATDGKTVLVDEQLAKGFQMEEKPNVKRAISSMPVMKPIRINAPNSVFALGAAMSK